MNILLMRHGKAEKSDALNDRERPLKNKGKRHSQRIGRWLAEQQLYPDQVISSPARRALESAEKAVKAMELPAATVHQEESLYDGGAAALEQLITSRINQADAQATIMIVGHNPGLRQYLSRQEYGEEMTAVSDRFPCNALAWLESEARGRALPKVRRVLHPAELPDKFAVATNEGIRYWDRPPYYYRQSGVIPFRVRNGQLQILLITSSSGVRWGLPKGIIEPGFSAQQSAIKESEEEAGVTGSITGQAVGTYQQEKWGGVCTVTLFPMQVQKDVSEEPVASSLRRRQWVDAGQVVSLISQPAQAELVARWIAGQHSDHPGRES